MNRNGLFASLLLLLTLAPAQGWAAKPVLATNGATETATATSLAYNSGGTSITVSSGSDRYLLLVAFYGADPGAFTAVNWDSTGTPQAMSAVSASACKKEITWAHYTCVWGLVAPTAGAKTLQVTWTNSVTTRMEAYEFTSVLQSGATANAVQTGEASGSSGTDAVITVTASTSNDLTVAAMEIDSSSTTLSTAASEVELVNLANSGGYGASVAHTVDGTSTALTWTITNNRSWGGIGFTLLGTAAGGATPRNLMLLGVGS